MFCNEHNVFEIAASAERRLTFQHCIKNSGNNLDRNDLVGRDAFIKVEFMQ